MRLQYFVVEVRRGEAVAVHPVVSAVDAEEGARIAARLSGGAIAFQQWVDEDMGEADAPDLLSVEGAVPRYLVEKALEAA